MPGEDGGIASLIGPFLARWPTCIDEMDVRGLGGGLRLAGNVRSTCSARCSPSGWTARPPTPTPRTGR